jgi:hypothetical protein
MGDHRGHGRDGWILLTGLISAGLALPLAQSAWHGPEVAAILAVASVARLAGQRWAVGVIVLADLSLLPTVLLRAVHGPAGVPRLIAIATIAMLVPGLLALRRAVTVLPVILGQTVTEQMYRRAQIGLLAVIVFAVIAPLL